jgi:predicted permease
LRRVEPGFTDAQHLQILRVSIPHQLVAEPERVLRIQREIADKLAAIPGVTSAAFASEMPMEGIESAWDCVYAQDKTYAAGVIPPLRFFKFVSPGYFHTVGTRLIAGRDLTWSEVYSQRPVVLLSESLAQEMWGAPAAAIGKRLRELPAMPWHEVIGVVQDVREKGVQEKAPEIVYWPAFMGDLYGPDSPLATMTFAVRSERAGTQGLLNEVREAVWSVNSNLPLASVRTMQEVYDESLARTSFTLAMLGIAGVMAMSLGVIGIYGVVSYSVSQRHREIGIRRALGAQSGDVLQMVLRQVAILVFVGVAIGVGTAFGLTRLMTSLLFGVTAHDPTTFAGVAVALICVALLASYIPARRAMRVDPVVALRYE